MRFPHTTLSPATLRDVVQEFGTRDGTDHSPLARHTENMLRQFEAGRVALHFDDQTETCNRLLGDSYLKPASDRSASCFDG